MANFTAVGFSRGNILPRLLVFVNHFSKICLQLYLSRDVTDSTQLVLTDGDFLSVHGYNRVTCDVSVIMAV